MPKVWHLPLEEAEAVLTATGIAYQVSRHQNEAVPEGELFSVSPPPRTLIGDGVVAILNVSSGRPRRPV